MLKLRLLIVEDEKEQREMLAGFLQKEGYQVFTAESGPQALKLFEEKSFELALLDLKMPGMDGLELLTRLKKLSPDTQVIVMTAFGTIETAVAAMREGAFHYVNKPIELQELLINLKKSAETHVILAENRYLREQLQDRFRPTTIIGQSKPMQEVLSTIARVAKMDTTVLILGESGTGKELVASAIHSLSPRRDKKFVAFSCSAIPETLLESELFGYERGAFTGANRRKEGRFELADGGTLFLDEIGDISLDMQIKLLRVLETHEFDRLGGKETIKVDVRILAATNQNLQQKMQDKTFRDDLYYRLNVINIDLPPLRERRDDIMLLVDHFIKRFGQKLGKLLIGVTPQAKDILMSYPWPGNVRELENVIERGVVLARGDVIDVEDLPEFRFPDRKTDFPVEMSLADLEKIHIERVLEKTKGSISKASEILGIHRNTLRLRMKEYGLSAE
jgi:DNA-binding NtrC family response regulator